MIPPVSVCHQLSWMGRPNASMPHRTASGLRGSPTLAMNRRSGHGCSRARSVPARIIIRIAVGAVYQTDTRSCWSSWYQRVASKSDSSTTLVTPSASGARIPYDIPVTQPGSAVHQNTSSGWRSRAHRAVTRCEAIAPCTWIAPFGVPVVPLVKCSSAMSSGRVSAIGKLGEALASNERRWSTSAPLSVARSSSTRMTWRRPGRSPRICATLRRYSVLVVTSTRASPSSRRWQIGSGPNAENSVQATLPCFSVPSTAVYSSGTRPVSMKTRSPRSTPSISSTFANRDVELRRAP